MNRFPRRALFLLLPLLLCIGAAVFYFLSVAQPNDARPQVRDAWNNARSAGGYSFRSDIAASNIPIAKPTRVGNKFAVLKTMIDPVKIAANPTHPFGITNRDHGCGEFAWPQV